MINIVEYNECLKKEVNKLMHDILVLEYGFNEFSHGILKADNKEFIQEHNKLWVALENDIVIATLGFLKIDDKNILLKKVYSHSAYRGKGISQKMLNMCINYVKEREYEYIHLETYQQLNRAIAFYEKNGFKQYKSSDKPEEKREIHYVLELANYSHKNRKCEE
ncbi:MAG: GNAT family N-acetyltransferase [Clostridia bacterium]